MAAILDGRKFAKEYRLKIKEFVDNRNMQGLALPCLAAVLVGDDGGSIFYVNSQRKVCEKLGVKYRLINLPENSTEEEVIKSIVELNEDNEVNGIILQLPLPKHINAENVIKFISPEKDVDCMTNTNIANLYKGEECFLPCTPKAIIELIKSSGTDIKGKHAVIVGRSNIVGKPTTLLLLQENATVTICHSKTKDLSEECKRADILISCVGKPGLIKKEFVKDDAIVIDVGTTNVDGKMKGDVCFEEVSSVASFITPVPGGVGAVTTTMLIKNTCDSCEKAN